MTEVYFFNLTQKEVCEHLGSKNLYADYQRYLTSQGSIADPKIRINHYKTAHPDFETVVKYRLRSLERLPLLQIRSDYSCTQDWIRSLSATGLVILQTNTKCYLHQGRLGVHHKGTSKRFSTSNEIYHSEDTLIIQHIFRAFDKGIDAAKHVVGLDFKTIYTSHEAGVKTDLSELSVDLLKGLRDFDLQDIDKQLGYLSLCQYCLDPARRGDLPGDVYGVFVNTLKEVLPQVLYHIAKIDVKGVDHVLAHQRGVSLLLGFLEMVQKCDVEM